MVLQELGEPPPPPFPSMGGGLAPPSAVWKGSTCSAGSVTGWTGAGLAGLQPFQALPGPSSCSSTRSSVVPLLLWGGRVRDGLACVGLPGLRGPPSCSASPPGPAGPAPPPGPLKGPSVLLAGRPSVYGMSQLLVFGRVCVSVCVSEMLSV